MSVETGPVAFFTDDHRRCDEIWSAVESAVDAGDTARAATLFAEFHADMLRHFAMEEEVLFPAFEQATGMQGGPTQVMRMEHEQMRAVLEQMANAASRGDFDQVVDHGDTLLMVVQQHNVKEEGVLYPMAEQRLASQWGEIASRLAPYEKKA